MHQRLVICSILIGTLACGGDNGGFEPEPTTSFQGCATVQTIAVGATVTGSLATSDCQLQGSFVDYHELRLDNARTVTITLNSDDLDAFLAVFDRATGNLVAQDDDGGGNLNARITQSFAAGTYVIAATSFDPNETGQYSLVVN
jgi:hypothetical protein